MKDGNIQDKTIYNIITTLLNDIFGYDNGEFIFDSTLYNENNEKIIKDNWSILQGIFKLPNKYKNQKKILTKTFKLIVDYLNNKYNFNEPIIIKKNIKSIYKEFSHTNLHQTIIKF
jgi:hypothetical protein